MGDGPPVLDEAQTWFSVDKDDLLGSVSQGEDAADLADGAGSEDGD